MMEARKRSARGTRRGRAIGTSMASLSMTPRCEYSSWSGGGSTLTRFCDFRLPVKSAS